MPLMADRSPLFHTVASLAGAPYTAADPDTRVPRDPAPRPRVTEAQLAQAEAAARVVKMAQKWADAADARGSGEVESYEERGLANDLYEAVLQYNVLLSKGE